MNVRTLLSHEVRPGDVIAVEGGRWEVRAVLLGALGQDSVYEVRRVGFTAPNDSDGFPTMTHVPVLMVRRMIEAGAAIVRRPSDESHNGD